MASVLSGPCRSALLSGQRPPCGVRGLPAHISAGAGEIGRTPPDGNIERLNRLLSAWTSGRWPLLIAGSALSWGVASARDSEAYPIRRSGAPDNRDPAQKRTPRDGPPTHARTAREGGSDSAAAADCGRSRSPIGALAAPGLEELAPRSMGGGMTTRQPGRLRFGATAARERDSPPDFTNPALSHRRDRPDVAFDLPSSRGVHRRHEPRGRHAPSRAPSAVGRPCRTSRPPAPAAVAGSLGPRWSSGG